MPRDGAAGGAKLHCAAIGVGARAQRMIDGEKITDDKRIRFSSGPRCAIGVFGISAFYSTSDNGQFIIIKKSEVCRLRLAAGRTMQNSAMIVAAQMAEMAAAIDRAGPKETIVRAWIAVRIGR